MSSRHTGGSVEQGSVLDGRLGLHHFIERHSVPVAVPELQTRREPMDVDLIVVCELAELGGEVIVTRRFECCGRSVHQQLQGREPLLAVDDAARLHAAEDRLLSLNHDRAEEVPYVRCGLSWA